MTFVTEYDPDSRSFIEYERDQITDVMRIDFLEAHGGWLKQGKKGMWTCANPFTNYAYPCFHTARDAIDWAIGEHK